jgi:hypothetical protein
VKPIAAAAAFQKDDGFRCRSTHPTGYVRRRHPFDIEAIVVLPDHLHAIWTLPEGDADFALRWRLITSLAN